MNDSGWTYIQLNSGDLSIRSFDTSQSFQNTLANPIILEGDRDYEVCMVSCQFYNCQPLPAGCYFQPMGSTDGVTLISPDPKTIGVTNSVYVNCSLCTQSNVGSQQTSVLSWVPSSVIIENGCVTDVTNLNKPVFYAPFLSRVWQPVSQKYIRDITVNFTLSTGALIPTVSGTFSTVVLAIRPV